MARRREEDEYYGEGHDREEKRERKADPTKMEIIEGCAIGAKCEGICRETHGKTCKQRYHYYFEPIRRRTTAGKKITKSYRRVEFD